MIARVLLFAAAGVTAASRSEAQVNLRSHRELNQRIDSIFSLVSRSDAPGCALGVFRDGRMLISRAYGMADIERGVAVSAATVFDAGSITKQFTAMATMLLVADGRLRLEDPVRRHLPELPPWADSVRLHHLLAHTGGTGDYLHTLVATGRDDRAFVSQDTALSVIARMRTLEGPPGSGWRYSNSGYVLLAAVIERASGMRFKRVVEERILFPLGMTRSMVMDDYRLVILGRATGYQPRVYGGFSRVDSHHHQVGDGGLFTTVEDLARWTANLQAPIVGRPDLVRRMQQPVALSDGRSVRYGFGLNVGDLEGEPFVWHGGAGGGFSSEVGFLPARGVGYACLCNTSSAPAAMYGRASLRAVIAVLDSR